MIRRLLRPALTGPGPMPQNPAWRLASRHALLHLRSGAVFTYIPKNACTTLRLSLALDAGLLSDPEDWLWIGENTGMLAATPRDILTAPQTPVILRCPYRRLASAFLDKIIDRRQPFWALQRATRLGLDIYGFTFRDFVTALQKPVLLAADQHWRPQGDLLLYDRYDEVLAMEDFATARARITELTGLELVDARGLTRHGTDAFETLEDRCYADVPIQELSTLKQAGRLPGYGALYDPDLVTRTARIYAGDIALYGRWLGSDGLLFRP